MPISLVEFFDLVTFILAMWALGLVIKAVGHFWEREDKGTWLLVIYAVFMFALFKLINTVAILSPANEDLQNYLGLGSRIIESGFIIIILYVIFSEISKTGMVSVLHINIEPVTEERKGSEGEKKHELELEAGRSYLLREGKSHKSYEIFYDYVTHDSQGLCISREYPETIRKQYGLEKTPIVWLTRTEGENTIKPNELEKLGYLIGDFLDRSEKPIILLDGLEYLISYNGFNKVLKFIHATKDNVSMKRAILIVSANPQSYDPKEFAVLEKELITL